MMLIKDNDYREILNTVYSLNCCQDKETFLDVLMPSLINMFHADCATFHLIQGYPWHIKVVESRSFKSAPHSFSEDKYYPGLYTANFYQQSPLLKEAISSTKAVFKIGESISLKDWEQSALYNQFIAPQNLFWEMFLTLRWKNDLEGMITLWRARDAGNYAGSDVRKAEILAPHLMLATHNVASLSHSSQPKPGSEASGGSRPEGFLLLDHKLKPLYFNEPARDICACINQPEAPAGMVRLENDLEVPGCVWQDCTNLLEMLKQEELPIMWPKERLIVTPANLRFRLECALIWKADRFDSKPNFVVTLNEIVADQDPGSSLQAKYKLSRRELEIIYHINRGLSYDEIADKLFISKLTVHTHIKNIYRKLGAKSRIELYRYVQSTDNPKF